jgi:hypothetical protein
MSEQTWLSRLTPTRTFEGAGFLDLNYKDNPLLMSNLHLHRVAYGLSDAEVAKMCEIGSTIDYGKFEGAGFRFACDTWKPGKRGC